MTDTRFTIPVLAGWLFAALLAAIGTMNLMWVHPVPGTAYWLLALGYLPPTRQWMERRLGWSPPRWMLIVLGVVVMWFTLGISDLADILGL